MLIWQKFVRCMNSLLTNCCTSSATEDSGCHPQLVVFSSFCSVLADPFCSVACSSTMADFFVVPVGMQSEFELAGRGV